MTPSQRIRELDGLRTVAVFIVILDHISFQFFGSAKWQLFIKKYIISGKIGVQLFFVISGFIITKLLVEEKNISGTLNLPRFYFKRFRKLLPPIVGLVGFVYFLSYLEPAIQIPRTCLMTAFTMTEGLFRQCNWELFHLWSLTAEEIFYLLWPASLLVLGRKLESFWFPVIMIGFSALCRAVDYIYGAKSLYLLNAMLILRFLDHMAIGSFIALYFNRFTERKVPLWLNHSFIPAASLGLIALVYSLTNVQPFGPGIMLFGSTVQGLALAMLVIQAVYFKDAWLSRLLGTPLFSFLGLCSYSLYLYQEPLANPVLIHKVTPLPWLAALLSLGATLALGILSYQVIEKFFQQRFKLKTSPQLAEI